MSTIQVNHRNHLQFILIVLCAFLFVSVPVSSQEDIPEETVVEALVGVVKDILVDSATMALDKVGRHFLGDAWDVFSGVFKIVTDKLKERFPALFDTRYSESERKEAAQKAAQVLATDPELKQVLLDAFYQLKQGQYQILVKLNVIDAKLSQIQNQTSESVQIDREILARIKRLDPFDFAPIKGLGYFQDKYGVVKFYYPEKLEKPMIAYVEKGIFFGLGSWGINRNTLMGKLESYIPTEKNRSTFFIIAEIKSKQELAEIKKRNRTNRNIGMDDEDGFFEDSVVTTFNIVEGPPYRAYVERKSSVMLLGEYYTISLNIIENDAHVIAIGITHDENIKEQLRYSIHSINFNYHKLKHYVSSLPHQ